MGRAFLMGETIPLDLGVQSSPGRYGPDGGARLINCFAQQADASARAKFPIYPFEGFELFANLVGGGNARGAISLGNYGYVVSGPLVFKVDIAGGVTQIGSFPGTGQVFMARNRKSPNPDIMIVSEGQRYILNNDVLTSIADTDLPAANSVTFNGGYFIATIQDGRYFISAVDDGTTWDALDFATAEALADELMCGYARGREVVLFSSESIEFHALTGASPFPFEATPGTTVRNLGLLCQHSVRDLSDVLFFVASDGTVRNLPGYEPVRISTHDVELAIDSVEDKSTIVATAYPWLGNQFYQISCPQWTWTYNALTQTWVERASYGLDRWRGEHFIKIGQNRIVGDYSEGRLYRLDVALFEEAGEHLVMKWRPPPVHKYPNPIGIDRLFVDCIPGVGKITGPSEDVDPLVMCRWSDDSGKTWSNEMWAPIGPQGAFSTRAVFDSLGQTNEDGRLFEIIVSASVARGITGASADVEVLEV